MVIAKVLSVNEAALPALTRALLSAGDPGALLVNDDADVHLSTMPNEVPH